jgi:hypothetical protein
MKNDRLGANGKSRRGRAWTLALVLGFVILLGFFALLVWIGRPANWSPIAWGPSSSIEGFSLDRSTLGPEGDWLLWFDSSLGAVCAKDLRSEKAVTALDPGDYFAVAPVAVVDGNLLALRSQRSSSLFVNLMRGLTKVLNRGGSNEDSSNPHPTSENRTTYVETIDLQTGNPSARSVSLVKEGDLEQPTDFELGRISFSPNGDRFAYWCAQESPGSAPLDATVTERLQIYGVGSGLKPSIDRKVASSGSFFVRSALLTSVGRSYWIGSEACLFLSLLDAGSLIPVDVRRGEFDAIYSIAEVSRTLSEENPSLQYGPEGIETLRSAGDGETTLLFWGRSEDSILFYLFDSQIRFRRQAIAETQEYELETMVWLPRSERLLVDDKARNRLVALSPYGESSESYPLPPDWRDGFRILGEDWNGALVGTNRRMFLRTSEDRRDWETIPLF